MGKSKEAILVDTIKGYLSKRLKQETSHLILSTHLHLLTLLKLYPKNSKLNVGFIAWTILLKEGNSRWLWFLTKKYQPEVLLDSEDSEADINSGKASSSAGTAQSRSRPRRKNVRASVENGHINNVMNALVKIADAIGKFISDDEVNATQLYEQVMSMEEFNEESLVAAFDHLMQHQKVAMK
ncbi:hypothetical protein CXB51_030526 [Gossypium anomalum]|uniref:Uncharacterized protein n=1 Tax=Gossypium anomalum TaxID=47600 RepID=A0A8J5YVC1_9ROSI|nr:hypothetical protein CXB51_030526 [Gossypium anomalum]